MVTGHRPSYRLISGFRVTLHRNCCYPSLSLSLTLIRPHKPHKPPIIVSRAQWVDCCQASECSLCRSGSQCHLGCSWGPGPGCEVRVTMSVLTPGNLGLSSHGRCRERERCLAPGPGLHSNHTQTHLQTSSTSILSLWPEISGGGMQPDNLVSSANNVLSTCS